MTRTFKVAIGAGYGDEGKGLFTDYFTEKMKSESDNVIVCRYSGGAQAGHTVHRGDMRHEFSHFGSGSLQGVPTYLGKEFVCHPILFREEFEQLVAKGLTPEVFVHEDCMMTTHFDVMINQIIEKHRGSTRHGSCGAGFNETIQRHVAYEDSQRLSTRIKYFRGHRVNPMFRMQKLRKYAYRRLSELLSVPVADIPQTIGDEAAGYLESVNIDYSLLADIKFFFDNVQVVTEIPSKFTHIVVEGAQGLQLHQYGGNFPHVTRSNTGIENLISSGDYSVDDDIEVVYISRCYQTKHGAGPFDNEQSSLQNITVVDPTNHPNDFQGSLRFAPLDTSKLIQRIVQDMGTSIKFKNTSIAITCLDQLQGEFDIVTNGRVRPISPESFVRMMIHTSEIIGFKNIYFSSGPSASDITAVIK